MQGVLGQLVFLEYMSPNKTFNSDFNRMMNLSCFLIHFSALCRREMNTMAYFRKSFFGTILFLFLTAVSANTYAAGKTIIILPLLPSSNDSTSWICAGTYDSLLRSLRRNNSIGVIPLSEVKRIAQYLGVKPGTPLPPETISRMTSLSGADEAVSLHLFYSNKKVSISVEIISASQGTVTKSFSIIEPIERIAEIHEALYQGIVSPGIPKIPPPKLVWVKTKVNKKTVWVKAPRKSKYPAAFEWYSHGIECAERDPVAALTLFVKTLKYDPEHTPALIAASTIARNDQGMIDGSLGYLLRADRILIKRGETRSALYASLMVKIADIYESKHDAIRPQAYLNRAFEVWKKRKDSFPDEYASFLSEIGGMYKINNSLNTSVDYYSMARELYEKNGNTNSLRYAWIMESLGSLYEQTERSSSSLHCYNTAMNVYTSHGLDKTVDYADCLFGYGYMNLLLGNINQGKTALIASNEIFTALSMNGKSARTRSIIDGISKPLRKNRRE